MLGTSAESIDTAEDRHKFSAPAATASGIAQPAWNELTLDRGCARRSRARVGYPVLVRPSYVLSGAAMGVASNDAELVRFLEQATDRCRRATRW